MKISKVAAALIVASAVTVPAFADDHGDAGVALPSEEQIREDARQMKQAGKERGAQARQAGEARGAAARQAGEDKGAEAKQAGEQKRLQAEEKAGEMKQQGLDKAEEARQAAEQAGAQAEDAANAAQQDANKIPPGMAKREQHPSSGKGSEQGQKSRAAEEKPWWRFWGE
jgi:hypothetical protein